MSHEREFFDATKPQVLACWYQRICPAAAEMDDLGLRVRHCIGFMFAALVSAAILRHSLHVYCGLSLREIRKYTFVALIALAFTLIFFRDAGARNSRFYDDDPPGEA